MKRMCIKALPPVLVIQLKRFGYDWEAGRALKFDDHFEVIYSFLLVIALVLYNARCDWSNLKHSQTYVHGLSCHCLKFLRKTVN